MTDIRLTGLEYFVASCPEENDADPGLAVRIMPNLGHINLRGDSNNADFMAATEDVLGQAVPTLPNTSSSGEHRVYWLGADEWLIVTEVTDTPDLLARLRESLAGQHASVVDVSGGQIAMRLEGPAVRDVLAKGCTLDFHAAKFKAGDCAQSGLAKAGVLIGFVGDQAVFEIVVRRSFAEYLVLWLRHAAREYRVKITTD